MTTLYWPYYESLIFGVKQEQIEQVHIKINLFSPAETFEAPVQTRPLKTEPTISRSVLACFSRSINFMRNTGIFLWIFIRLLLRKRITFAGQNDTWPPERSSPLVHVFYNRRKLLSGTVGHCFCASCTVTVFPHTFRRAYPFFFFVFAIFALIICFVQWVSGRAGRCVCENRRRFFRLLDNLLLMGGCY